MKSLIIIALLVTSQAIAIGQSRILAKQEEEEQAKKQPPPPPAAERRLAMDNDKNSLVVLAGRMRRILARRA